MNNKQPPGKAEGLPETGGSLCESIDTPPLAQEGSGAISPAVNHAAANERESKEPSSIASKSCSKSGNESLRPNCYECKHRSALFYSAHSKCSHPIVAENELVMVAYGHRITLEDASKRRRRLVKGNQHGINNGWFCWPIDFDPVWLEECLLFEPK